MSLLNYKPLTGIVICCLALSGCGSELSDLTDSTDSNVDTKTDISTYAIVDTGQSSCYDNDGVTIFCPDTGEELAGQDAQFTGNQFSYTDTGDGTVADNITGLTWQQTPDNIGLSWSEAVDVCDDLELGSKRCLTLKTE